jgi:hypothetical protein
LSKAVLIAARGPEERVSAPRPRQVCARLNPEHLDPIEPLLVALPRCHAAFRAMLASRMVRLVRTDASLLS